MTERTTPPGQCAAAAHDAADAIRKAARWVEREGGGTLEKRIKQAEKAETHDELVTALRQALKRLPALASEHDERDHYNRPWQWIRGAGERLALADDFGMTFRWRPRKGARWYPDADGGSVSSALHGDECVAEPTPMFREHQELAAYYGRYIQSDRMVHLFHVHHDGYWTPESPDEFRKPQWNEGWTQWYSPLRLGPSEPESETIERLGLQSEIDAYVKRLAARESERAELARSARARAEHEEQRKDAKRRIICVAHMGDVEANFDPKHIITRRMRTEARRLVGDDEGLERLANRAMAEGLDVVLEEVATMRAQEKKRLREEDERETRHIKSVGPSPSSLGTGLADALRAALK